MHAENAIAVDMRYNPLSVYLKRRFGSRVRKAPVNAGFGCPTRDKAGPAGGCAFCDPDLLLPDYHEEGLTVSEQIGRGAERAAKRHGTGRVIAYFQAGTNTHGDTGRLRALYAEALAHPATVGISVGTRPDCVPDDVLALLAGLRGQKDVWLELGLQSANDATLSRMGRGHTAWDFKDAVSRAHRAGIDVCAHVIFGLPGEGRADMLDTIRLIAGLGVWGVKFHQLQVVRGTRLHDDYEKGGLSVLTLDEYAGLVVKSLELLPPDVVIHRLSGDTPPARLVAPRWGLEKSGVKKLIERLLAEGDTRQGAGCRA